VGKRACAALGRCECEMGVSREDHLITTCDRRAVLLVILSLVSGLFPLNLTLSVVDRLMPGGTVLPAVTFGLVPFSAMGVLMAWAFRELPRSSRLRSRAKFFWAAAILLTGFVGAAVFLTHPRKPAWMHWRSPLTPNSPAHGTAADHADVSPDSKPSMKMGGASSKQ